MTPAAIAQLRAALQRTRCNVCRTPWAEHHSATCPQYVVDWAALAVLVASWVEPSGAGDDLPWRTR